MAEKKGRQIGRYFPGQRGRIKTIQKQQWHQPVVHHTTGEGQPGNDQKGNVYVGIYLGDIEIYDTDGHFLKKLKLPGSDKKFDSPRSMAMIDNTTLIVRSVINQLYAIDIRSGSCQTLSHLLPLHI